MDFTRTIYAAMKAATWERAKGELRALVAMKGSTFGDTRDENGEYGFEPLERAVEAFIKTIEDEGLNE